jgi:hypothetical protein
MGSSTRGLAALRLGTTTPRPCRIRSRRRGWMLQAVVRESPRAICSCCGIPQRLKGTQHHSVALIDRRQRLSHGRPLAFRSNAPALIISAIRGGVSLAGSPAGSTISASTISSGSSS